jgi:hypothetical protein
MNQPQQRKEDATQEAHVESMKRPVAKGRVGNVQYMRSGIIKRIPAETSTNHIRTELQGRRNVENQHQLWAK